MNEINFNAQHFGRDLLSWYDRVKRPLPWRETRDPYKILVSELMLQQTQVQTVIPYYHRFLEKFPDAAALAAASEESLLKQWQGLGYYRRARYLQKAAQQITDQHKGRFPDTKETIQALSGVGAYTSAAVASIAFDLPYACVDGNVYRVLSRLLAMDEDITATRVKAEMQKRAQQLLEPARAGDYNQAVMELGATVCTPRKPSCMTCPVNRFCSTHSSGDNPETRPHKSKRVVASRMTFESLCLYSGQRLLLARRPPEGLMAGMWELPSRARDEETAWEDYLEDGVRLVGRLPKPIAHRFTHLHASYRISIYTHDREVDWKKAPDLYPETRWVGKEDLVRLPLTNVLLKTLPELTRYLKGEQECQPQTSTLPGMQTTT